MKWKMLFDNTARQYYFRRKNRDTTRVTIFKKDKLVWIEDCEADSLVYCTTRLKRRFKTLREAYKFARDWIKKHPNG